MTCQLFSGLKTVFLSFFLSFFIYLFIYFARNYICLMNFSYLTIIIVKQLNDMNTNPKIRMQDM